MRRKPTKEILGNVKKTYSQIAGDFSKTRQGAWDEFKVFLKHIKNGDSIADIGCGNGRFYSFLAKNLSPKKKISYIGIDNSPNLLKEAKKLISTEKKTKGNTVKKSNKITFRLGDILKIPLQNNSYDLVSCIAVLHHIPSKELRSKAVKELHRILKKNGTLFLTVWNLLEQSKYKKHVRKAFFKWLFTLGKYEKRGLSIPWGDEKIPRYYYAFKHHEIEKLLKPYFKIKKELKDKNLTYICEKL